KRCSTFSRTITHFIFSRCTCSRSRFLWFCICHSRSPILREGKLSMRDNALVIPSRADGEGPRNRSKIHTRNAFAVHEALASNRPLFGLCNFNANVRSFAVLRGSG